MRNISFSMTTDQFRARTKTVTRRLGWADVKPGDRLMGIEKGQGLKKGEKVVQLGVILVKNVTVEPLSAIGAYFDGQECVREGFPNLTAADFIAMFCDHNKSCTPETEVTRIEFEYVDVPGAGRTATTVIDPAAKWPFPRGKMP